MIGIVDYGTGNIGSLRNALTYLDIPCQISSNPQNLKQCSGLILPGVGAFQPAMEKLESLNLVPFIKDWVLTGHSLLGICLGMQLLFTESEEDSIHLGLNLIPGKVIKLKDVPRSVHIGWNRVTPEKPCTFLPSAGYAYFVHKYACKPDNPEHITGTTSYGETFPSAVQTGKVIGVQFHPEKSQTFGLNMLKRFAYGII